LQLNIREGRKALSDNGKPGESQRRKAIGSKDSDVYDSRLPKKEIYAPAWD